MNTRSDSEVVQPDDPRISRRQRRVLEEARREILEHDGYGPEYEFKRFEVTIFGGRSLFLHTVVGRVGDEGTAAEAFARRTRHIAIGARGGVLLLNPDKGVGPHRRRGSHAFRSASR